VIVIIAFISGFVVCALSLVAPHARSQKSSIEEFVNFQSTLSTLASTNIENRQHTVK